MSSPVSQAVNQPGILAQRCARDARRYFERHGYLALPDLPAPDPALGMVIVIPAIAEPAIVATLESVAAATRPGCAVELLVVINAPDSAGAETRRINTQGLADVGTWASGRESDGFRYHALDYRDLPARYAGVGLARKIGMDTGLARLASSTAGRGVLVSLDADCRVAPSYLTAIDRYFRREADALAATIYFEHPIDDTPIGLRAAIIDYELHLRCYCHGLQAAGLRYARYALGSALAVRSEVYAQEGGMNRRAAGEDFYFLNKLLKRGHVGEIADTTVFPAARVSDRVPFGTGAALSGANTKSGLTYAPAVYDELRRFAAALQALAHTGQSAPPGYAPFLETMGFAAWFDKTRANAASASSLAMHLRRWLDGFRILKFVHWLTASRYPRVPVADAASAILGGPDRNARHDPRTLLEQFRALDKHSAPPPSAQADCS